jgi:hypothetical protein
MLSESDETLKFSDTPPVEQISQPKSIWPMFAVDEV